MRLLILGGTSFVGRAFAEAASAGGHDVTLLNRGLTDDAPGIPVIVADRDRADGLAALTGDDWADATWDAVIDVSGLNAARVLRSTRALRDRVDHYLLVSTVSVYDDAPGAVVTEDSPTYAGDADDPTPPTMAVYGEQKRGAELAALRTFGADRVSVLRPGVILGPYENVGRIAYWWGRTVGTEPFIAPGDPDRPFDIIDSRDLADFGLRLLRDRTAGIWTCLAPPGRDSWGDFIASACWATGATAEPVWIPDAALLAEQVTPWSGLPMWNPAEPTRFETAAAEAAGLVCRPLADTVDDCWAWLTSLAEPPTSLYRGPALDRAREAEILAAYAAAS
jgi:nucleoside-diphosphate-sugar epimerase